ncbi:two component system response regulator PieR [Listeria ivanovii]|uniref:Putative two-component response regulators n=1 Tax=Listeria ivanovii (strain ATCC BAA-678 / PAM 55) TaxID=881621 RepID=G2Z949_LISIP|nr:two component system response regulator PieR [Listeria ivanovii]AHI56003.1 LuxR family transcriptional regulator [Listeria ivanovii WSLC3009]AIS65443.1 LuxR family transcriptional regulator [Listeria ivanovii subsp. ivanovii]MBC1759354.1 response regulator transcription factor [Listeria ivanovii]MBK3914395.1 response regulator transcription factor [Listeria ivanovii subsp. ivanovii]MBK3921706.1 response regulator transcription factor [Listeria ivanovii subsp. ivanovii]
MKLLMIEDNVSVCEMIEMFFIKEEINATFVHDGKLGYETFLKEDFDIAIIDLMLPNMDGMTICRKIREVSDMPIIILTAKESESDQVLGLEMGADDYVTKPFSPLTLMARIKAVTRRKNSSTLAETDEDILETTYFKISKRTREIFYQGELLDALTPKEFDLLYFLMKHPRQVFSREQLLEQVWGYQFYGDERTVDVHIKRLRQKIATETKPFLHTIWGVGYKFDETE